MGSGEIWRPDVTVATVVERDGRFLFVEERIQGRLVINQPAGHLDPNETLVDAAVRETLEETAWDVQPTGLVAIYQWISADGAAVVRFTFAAQALAEHSGRCLDDGIERVLWLRPEELELDGRVLRTPMVRTSIEDYRKGPLLPLDVLHDMRFR